MGKSSGLAEQGIGPNIRKETGLIFLDNEKCGAFPLLEKNKKART